MRPAWRADAGLAARGPRSRPGVRRGRGDIEFQTDGTSVKTVEGWREMRLSDFAERPRGEPVTDLDAWPGERLPGPEARVASAGLRTNSALGPQ